jgi:NhaA family Na+:H+ antiporter
LLAQAATALSALANVEKSSHASHSPPDVAHNRVWEWASRNLTAASERLKSPADRVEQAIEPWSNYLILPLFAFSATGVTFELNLASAQSMQIFAGVVLGLVVGKPLGIILASGLATMARLAKPPQDVDALLLIGAACLCGVGDTVALLISDQAFADEAASAVAKAGVLIGSVTAAFLGAGLIWLALRTPSSKTVHQTAVPSPQADSAATSR